MPNIWDCNFIVTDVETTGSSGEHNRITEIACVVMRGGEVQHSFTSLINPRQFIPPFIEQLTGISNAMVYNAPEERIVMEEVAKLLRLPDAVFVAHNEQFDWSFVFHALKRSGIDMPNVERLCTCKIARRLLPKQRKKNLGSVASYYGINIDARHRAYGDADATARVLAEMLDTLAGDHEVENLDDLLLFQNKRLKNFHATPRTLKRIQPTLDALPEEPGVYYMLDSDERLMYIGKAKSLAERVRSYFQMSAVHPPKIAEMVRKVHSILWEETGTELAALLQESREIKEHKPPYNTMSKKLRRYPFLKLTNEEFPRLDLCFAIENDGAEYYGPFPGRGMVEGILETIKKNFTLRLCSEMGEPDESVQPCFYYHVKQCKAPCAALQSHSDYAKEVEMVRKFLSGYSHGIIAMLEHEMADCAERLEFENAAMLRNRIRELRKLFDRSEEVSSAVHKTNVVIILPASEREKTVELFCIRMGMLSHQEIIGRKASLMKLFARIQKTYYIPEQEAHLPLTPLQVDELRILTQWMYRRRNAGTYIYLDTMTFEDVCAAVENAVRTVFIPTTDISNKQSDITDNLEEYAQQ